MPWTLFETSIGPCGLAWSGDGITRAQLPEATREQTEDRLLSRTRDCGSRATTRVTPEWVLGAITLVVDHLAGRATSGGLVRVPLDLSDITAFNAKVYRALQAVPAGTTLSYGELARAIGSPGASRAVGRAMAMNPFPIFVPCHRVLASGNKPGGFSAHGGVATKERILAIEGALIGSP